MAMTAGSVSIDGSHVETKSGLAGDMYDAAKSAAATQYGAGSLDGANGLAFKRVIATLANGFAGGIVTHLTANAKARVEASLDGLQRDNTVGNPSTLGPSASKFIPIV